MSKLVLLVCVLMAMRLYVCNHCVIMYVGREYGRIERAYDYSPVHYL